MDNFFNEMSDTIDKRREEFNYTTRRNRFVYAGVAVMLAASLVLTAYVWSCADNDYRDSQQIEHIRE